MPEAAVNARRSLVETRRFYLALSVLIAILALVGFWPRYFRPLLSGALESDVIIHVHAAVYVGWVALFVLQCSVVAAGKIHLHRRIGGVGLFYGVIVIAVGLVTAIVRFQAALAEGGIESVQHSALAPMTDMVVFSAFFGAAAWYRKQPELHKRLMVVAASTILVPSLARMTGTFGFEPALRHGVLLALWLAPILLAMGYDLYRRRLIHPVYVVGMITIVITSFRMPLRFTDTWVGFTHWLASVVS